MRLATANSNPPSVPEASARAGNAIRLAARLAVLSARAIAWNRASRTSGIAADNTWVKARVAMPPGAGRRKDARASEGWQAEACPTKASQAPSAMPAMKAAMSRASCWYT